MSPCQLVEHGEELVQLGHHLTWFDPVAALGEVDEVGEHHGHLVEPIGDHLVVRLEPVGDGSGQDVEQQRLGALTFGEEGAAGAQCLAEEENRAHQGNVRHQTADQLVGEALGKIADQDEYDGREGEPGGDD